MFRVQPGQEKGEKVSALCGLDRLIIAVCIQAVRDGRDLALPQVTRKDAQLWLMAVGTGIMSAYGIEIDEGRLEGERA